ncbi:YggT family protein [Salinarimonas ramus]|uniref:Membrane protein n=1 Tax=Salinarimonas ramus TaxID=690164 RepID=A0A917QB92_9HYPH|nr:YggT family protein [Salinarimonas ramus]GGK40942.1 membrane protein [Salinarimonas ramus]
MIALFQTIDLVLGLLTWLIIGSAILSWLIAFGVVNMRNDVVRAIYDVLSRLTEPLLRPIRNILPNLGGIDISPIVLLLLIFFLRSFLMNDVAPAVL